MLVSKWLGHSSFTLTLDVYGDYIPEDDGGAVNTAAGANRPGEARRAYGEQCGEFVWAAGELGQLLRRTTPCNLTCVECERPAPSRNTF